MKAFDGWVLFRLFSREPAAVNEKVEGVDGRQPREEPGDRRSKRAELECLRHHLKADGGEEDARGKAHGDGGEQASGLPPERDQSAQRRGESSS